MSLEVSQKLFQVKLGFWKWEIVEYFLNSLQTDEMHSSGLMEGSGFSFLSPQADHQEGSQLTESCSTPLHFSHSDVTEKNTLDV